MALFVSNSKILLQITEYYDLSYQYINDCLKAGLVYREFYQDQS